MPTASLKGDLGSWPAGLLGAGWLPPPTTPGLGTACTWHLKEMEAGLCPWILPEQALPQFCQQAWPLLRSPPTHFGGPSPTEVGFLT